MISAASLVLGLTLVALPAAGQFFVAGTATFPTGEFKDMPDTDGLGAKTGWMVSAGFRAWQNAEGRLAFWLVGDYGQSSVDGLDDSFAQDMTYYSGGGYLAYALGSNPDASVTPFIVGGGGYSNLQDRPGESSDIGEAFATGGVGLSFGKEGKGPWVFASYRYGFDEVQFFGLGAGWTF